MADTIKASVITDHAFEPRNEALVVDMTEQMGRPAVVRLPPNPHLCRLCSLAEAAHRETTVKRETEYYERWAKPS